MINVPSEVLPEFTPNTLYEITSRHQIKHVHVFPSPLQSIITIRYDVIERGDLWITIYDSRGDRVHSIMSGEFHDVGRYETTLDGSILASGVYYAIVQTSSYIARERIVVAH